MLFCSAFYRINRFAVGVLVLAFGFGRPASAVELVIHPDAPALDGKVAVSVTSSTGKKSIKLIDFKKRKVTSLIVSEGVDEHPDWSPDGTRIAFQSDRSGNMEIYTARADGTDVRRLTKFSGVDEDPSFSPDGKRIAFKRSVGKWGKLFLMNADGSGVEQLTEGNFHDAKPSWSPDGRALLMSSSANFPGWDIYQLDLETKKRRRKTGGKGTFCRPDWRPNGEWFSYTHSNGEGFNLWLEPLNGNPTRITHYAGKDYDVRWIDNDSLIFVRNRGGEDNRYALILLRLSNGKAVQLTDGSDSLRDPTWTR